jgi:hypothetical protein
MKTKYTVIGLMSLLVMLSCSQNADNSESKIKEEKEADKRYFAELEANALKRPYEGIFSEEGKIADLFPVYSTGVSTEPIVNAAAKFLESLLSDQIEKITFPVDDKEWRKWCNVDNGIYVRQGVSLKEMSKQQKSAAFSLMQTSLSAKGLQLSKDIMKTDHTLKELNNGSYDYDEELYFFTIMGEPSSTEPWGWQLDGHHLIINYFVLGDQVVMSPVFMGAEPVITTTGKYKGNTLFQDEQNLGLALIRSLSKEQQSKAIIFNIKTGNNNKASANKDNITLNYEGLKVSEFTKKQRDDLLDLVFQYINNMREGHQKIKMEEVIEYIDDTWFAWIGDTSKDAVFYYRIHSPVVLIEFDHQKAVGVPYERTGKPTRNHIHTVVRTPYGNDYGKDLLRQHLETHPH